MRNPYVNLFSFSLLPLVAQIHASSSAHAAEITISDDRTTTQDTATIDSGAPGDILIDPTGSVMLTSGTAVHVNSNNYLTNEGTIEIEDSLGSIGVLIDPGLTSNFTNSGSLILRSTDNTSWFANKAGVSLASGTMTGSIVNNVGAVIGVAGEESALVNIGGHLIGDFINEGQMDMVGDNNYGFLLTGEITGEFVNRGLLRSETVVQDLDNDPSTIELFSTNATVAIGGSISDGFVIDGLTTEEINDNIDDTGTLFGSITSAGGTEVILISPTLQTGGYSDITIGSSTRTLTGEGFVNLGTISSVPQQSPMAATGMRVEGLHDSGTDYITTIVGGFRNDGDFEIKSFNADATGLHIGPLANVSSINNNGAFNIEGGGLLEDFDVVAIDVETTLGSLSIVNTGALTSVATAHESLNVSAIAIRDTAGIVSSVHNTGVMTASATRVDDFNIGTTTPGVLFDFSANTSGVTVFNAETVGAAENTTGLLGGAIFFGSGNDTLTMESGGISSNVDLSGGFDSVQLTSGLFQGDISYGTGGGGFHLNGQARYVGDLDTGTGGITSVINGQLELQSAGPIDLSTLNIGSNAVVWIPVDAGGSAVTQFNVTGAAQVDSGATFRPTLLDVITSPVSVDIISAGSLTMVGGLPVLDVTNLPFIYDFGLVDTGNLTLEITPKATAALGTNALQIAVMDPLLEVASTDPDLALAVHSIVTQNELHKGLNQAAPNNTNATYHLGLQSFEGLAHNALHTRHRQTAASRHTTRFWATESGYYRDQDEVDGHRGYIARDFRMSAGVDVATENLDRLGFAGSLSYQGFKPDGASSNPYNTTAFWLAGYASTSVGNLELSGIGGFAFTNNKSDKKIELGSEIIRAEGDWSGTQWAVRGEAKYTIDAGNGFYLQPKASLTYYSLDEDAFEETGDAGAALMGSDFSMAGIRGEVGTAAGFQKVTVATTYTTEFEVGYRVDSAAEESREYQFVGGTTPFELMAPEVEDGGAYVGLSVFGLTDYTALGVSYRGTFGSDSSDHMVSAVIRTRF